MAKQPKKPSQNDSKTHDDLKAHYETSVSTTPAPKHPANLYKFPNAKKPKRDQDPTYVKRDAAKVEQLK